MKSIYFVIESSVKAHPKQRAVSELWLKKGNKLNFRLYRLAKDATPDNVLNVKLAYLDKFANVILEISSKKMPSNFYFFKFVMVKSLSLIYEFSIKLTIRWLQSRFTLSFFLQTNLKVG